MTSEERSKTGYAFIFCGFLDRGHRIGDLEINTIIGKGCRRALLTMDERNKLYTLIIRLIGKRATLQAEVVVAGMKYLNDRVKTINLDNGLTMLYMRLLQKD
jgi:IS30 family transposase